MPEAFKRRAEVDMLEHQLLLSNAIVDLLGAQQQPPQLQGTIKDKPCARRCQCSTNAWRMLDAPVQTCSRVVLRGNARLELSTTSFQNGGGRPGGARGVLGRRSRTALWKTARYTNQPSQRTNEQHAGRVRDSRGLRDVLKALQRWLGCLLQATGRRHSTKPRLSTRELRRNDFTALLGLVATSRKCAGMHSTACVPTLNALCFFFAYSEGRTGRSRAVTVHACVWHSSIPRFGVEGL